MKRLRWYIKNIFLFILNKFFLVFWIFKIDKQKIFFMSYAGRQYACNPKYVSEYLIKKYNDKYTLIWAVDNEVKLPAYGYISVKPKTFKYYYHLLTSQIIIHNVYIPPWLPYRRKQVIINTWHGGGLGKFPYYDFENLSWYNKQLLKEKTTYFLSSSKKFSNLVIRGTFKSNSKILEIGLPRNDELFERKVDYVVHDFYHIRHDTDILLYAPTYRDIESKTFIKLDLLEVVSAWKKKTGKDVVMLYRPHPLSKQKVSESAYVKDGSKYEDMQHILKETACYITDYSSAIWDYCILEKPCILYVPDSDEYENNRKLYMKPAEYKLPFCKTNTEVLKIIRTYSDNDYKNAIYKYKNLLGTFEKGTATVSLVSYIEKL